MAVVFEDFLKELKPFASVEHGGISEATALLKGANSSIETVDEALKSINVTESKTSGVLLFNNETGGQLYNTLREADLAELVRISDKDIVFNSSDVRQFKEIVGKTPESKINDIEKATFARTREFPHLNVIEEDLPQMSNTAKNDVKKIENSLRQKFKDGTAIALTIGVVYVGVDWIVNALKARRGCFLVTNINNKITSCKIQDFSCSSPTEGNFCDSTPTVYNTTLQLMAISELDDANETKIKVAELAGIKPAELKDQLYLIIDKHFKELSDLVKNLEEKFPVKTCSITNDGIEDNKVPPCRLCSPTTNPTSTEFIDPAQYADNVTYKCVPEPTILDVITDAAIATGIDLFDVISKSIFQLLKPILILGAILLFIAIIIYVVFKAISNRQLRQQQQQQQQPAIIYRNI